MLSPGSPGPCRRPAPGMRPHCSPPSLSRALPRSDRAAPRVTSRALMRGSWASVSGSRQQEGASRLLFKSRATPTQQERGPLSGSNLPCSSHPGHSQKWGGPPITGIPRSDSGAAPAAHELVAGKASSLACGCPPILKFRNPQFTLLELSQPLLVSQILLHSSDMHPLLPT